MEFSQRIAGGSARNLHDRRDRGARQRGAGGRLDRAAAGGGRGAGDRRGPGVGARALARSGLSNLAGAGFAGLAGLAVTWLVARSLGPAAAGGFFAATAAFVLVTAVARLGTPTGLVYWVANARAQGQPEVAACYARIGIGPVAVAATGLGTGMWLVGAATGNGALQTLAPFLPAAAVTDALLATTRGYRLMRPTVAVDKLLRPALQLLGVAVLALAALWMVVPGSAWPLVWALPYLPALLLAGYALHTVQRRQPVRRRRTSRALRSAFWRFTGPRAVASVLQLALQRLDILLVAALAGPVPAAVYTVAGRFVVVGQLVNQAIGHPLQPRLAERLSAGDLAGAGALYRTVTGWLVLTTWPLYLLVIGHAPLYLGLFGGAYRTGATAVVVLAAAMLLATGCGPVDLLLAMAGRTSWNLLNVGLALAMMVGLDALLIPRLGALGAAIGLAAAVATNNLLPLAQIWYALRLHPFGAGTLAAAGLAAGCFGALPLAIRALAGTGLVAVVGSLAAAVATYLAGARRLRHLFYPQGGPHAP
ncbi:MAG TPA: polysaccharide biosynthesis C-terminal domain-containing protein [Natronosporangium sp.]